ncbi:MAG: sodium:proline symporter [Candidatus Gallionella acididurans]|uniref:Sodium:proline symporter n=1 Tax=Candidatus Gallionella acididurans TaxID=1796491 RepID=A0A139BXU6_9PROT|nr:MAG: sodium:proline symporter [Candidatus Gallionella acididurans]
MFKCSMNHRPDWSTAVLAGVIAGTSATLVQMLLWLVFTDAFPAILFRDARLTAALVLGSSVLPPPATFDTGIMLAATLVHFALSVVYAALLARLTSGLENIPALLAGAAFGIVLYFINLYGFTAVFPWFAQARGWITLIAHAVFGVTVTLVCRYPSVKNTQGIS